jgi:hypothetical protein
MEGTSRPALSSPFLVAALILAASGPARAAEPEQVLLVGSLGPRGKDDTGLLDLIQGRILAGLDAARGEGGLFANRVSMDELAQQGKMVLDLSGYRQVSGAVVDLDLDKVHNLPKVSGRRLDGYLRTTVTEGGTRVDLELYRQSSGRWTILRKKTVGGPDVGKQDLLDRVFDASRRIASRGPSEDHPQALVDAPPKEHVVLGEKVVLDGSPSQDQDHDALSWLWCEDRLPPGARRVLPTVGVFRRRVEFTPAVPGIYSFTLRVQEAVREANMPRVACTADRTSESTPITFEVVKAPEVAAGDSRQIELDSRRRTPVALEGTCEACKELRWRQLSGPQLTKVGDDTESTCSDWKPAPRSCSFTPGPPGEYVFELSGRNEAGERRSTVKVLAAPPPVVVVGPRQLRALVGQPLALDGTASYDFIDPHPEYRWEVREGAFDPPADACVPSRGQGHEAMVLQPRTATATFLARSPGTYHVRLLMIARREFAGRQMSAFDCATTRVEVEPRNWWGWMSGGGHVTLGAGLADTPQQLFSLHLGGNWVFHQGWGIRLVQTLFSYSWDDGRKALETVGSHALGGSTLALSHSFREWNHFGVRPFVGGQFGIVRKGIIGPGGGVDIFIHLADNWAVALTADLHRLYKLAKVKDKDNAWWDLRLAGGLGYAF